MTQSGRPQTSVKQLLHSVLRMKNTAVGLAIVVATFATIGIANDHSPGPRYGHEMVYDEAREVVVLFGGFGPDGVPKGDTWLWDGQSWRLAAKVGPSPRKWPAAAYDSHRGVVVLHGGREGAGRSGPSMNDTWIWDGQRWTEILAEGPTARDHHRAVYDRARDRIVLFGGWNGESLEDDTWEWDGSHWEQVALTGPSPRAPFGMAYDESTETVVIAGGQNLDRAFSDMWAWSGSSWNLLDSKVPTDRGFHAMVYAPDANSIVIYGGRDGDILLNDLWTWNGIQWTQISSDGPIRRGIFASAYDRQRGELLIHGGGDRIDGEWILNSQTWAWSSKSGWRAVGGTE